MLDNDRLRTDAVNIPKPTGKGPFNLSYQQNGIWFVEKLFPGNDTYHVSNELILRGDINLSLLAEAWRGVINKHDALRTVIRESNGDPYVYLLADISGSLEISSDHLESHSGEEWEEIKSDYARQPFDLENGPLIRAKLLSVSSDECRMLLIFHHLVIDHWSINILLKQFHGSYVNLLNNTENGDDGSTSHYYDYTRKQIEPEHLKNQAVTVDEVVRSLQPATVYPELSTPQRRQRAHHRRGARYTHLLTDSLHGKLKELANREHTSLFTVVFSAFTLLVQQTNT